ncbi:MAG: hypothetical protein KC776_28430 [Myxococcales bacterium]|nr:hypothetical protein [Myxococcales bacterium]MCB9581119.1 hypothetical protein [Polyangiaceae bacterium]
MSKELRLPKPEQLAAIPSRAPWPRLGAAVLLALVALLAIACMTSPMEDGNEQMRRALVSAGGEISQHAEACARTATLPGVTDELQRHEQAMDGILDRADAAMGEMHGMHCSGNQLDSMMSTLANMRTTMDDHAARLSHATDVTDAQKECARYRDDMLGLCDSARDDNEMVSCM